MDAHVPQRAPLGRLSLSSVNARLDARLTPRTTAAFFWSVLVALVVLGIFLPPIISQSALFALAAKIVLNVAVALWVLADGRARGFSEDRLRWYAILSACLTEIAVPVYLVKSRGWKGALAAGLRFLGYVLLAAVSFALAAAILEALGLAPEALVRVRR